MQSFTAGACGMPNFGDGEIGTCLWLLVIGVRTLGLGDATVDAGVTGER